MIIDNTNTLKAVRSEEFDDIFFIESGAKIGRVYKSMQSSIDISGLLNQQELLTLALFLETIKTIDKELIRHDGKMDQ